MSLSGQTIKFIKKSRKAYFTVVTVYSLPFSIGVLGLNLQF